MKKSLIPGNITFSILMANYNNGKFIKEAINSVISQTYSAWELIIADDCSTDDSVKIIKSFLNDKRIKLIRHNKNIGYGGALRTAAYNANNTIFAILDSDDKFHETALEVMVNAYQNNPEYGFIYSTMWNCDSELKNCVINKDIGKIIPANKTFFKIRIAHFKTFRKDAYNKTSGFDESQKRAVDKDLIFKLEEVTKFKFIDIPLYYYRHHESGMSQENNKFQAYVYFYIAKCKAYRRRLKTDFPNCSRNELYIDYFIITFNRMIKSAKKLCTFFKISMIVKKFENKCSKFLFKRYPKLKYLKNTFT